MKFASGSGLLLLTILSACILAVQGESTTCKIEIIDGTDTGRLTCSFSEDIGRAKYNFNVLRYDRNNSDVVPETVFACYWPKTGGPEPSCKHNPLGFVLIGNVTDKVVLEIPNIGKNHEGRYQCQIVPSNEHKPGQCQYIFHEHRGTGSATEENQAVGTTLIVVIAFLVVFVIAFTIVFILLIRKNDFRCRGNGNRGTDEESTPMDQTGGSPEEIEMNGHIGTKRQ